MNKFYITTPIYYVNDKPHIGHAYTTILADVLARYHRLLGDPTHFLTGTDEHGQKVAGAAAERGVTPQQHTDETVKPFVDLWQRLEITNDDFIRTTEPRHTTIVQQILQDLFDRDEIYKSNYEGWYCVPCERFFTEKDVEDEVCPDCKRPVEKLVESNYFFRMSKYQEWLIDYINSNPSFIQPDFRRNETLGFLRQPLEDLCISRPKSRLPWGIDLPFDDEYVCYVWFDALVNYISAIGYRSNDEQFAKWWPASYHLIGKDILTTHTVYWPTMLKAIGIDLPETIFAHGWWLVGKNKMGKSVGNAVDPIAICDEFGVDAFRYFLMAEMVLGQDASFSDIGFIERFNTDLADSVGNMLNRVLQLIQRNAGGVIPQPADLQEIDETLRDTALAAVEKMATSVTEMKLDRGLEAVMGLVAACNRYFEQTTPWFLARDGETERLHTVLYNAAEALRIVSGLLYPVMPDKMNALRRGLGIAADQLEPDLTRLQHWGELVAGTKTEKIQALFPRIDLKEYEARAAAASDKSAADIESPKTEHENVLDLITFDDFSKVKLKTAKIKSAERVEGADRLLRLELEMGKESRQIVAGIAKFYEPESLIDRMIVVVSNMTPATIRGVESNGMLLAAKKKKKLTLVTLDGDFPSGADVS
jgi:methionyl-tRNA synthetase